MKIKDGFILREVAGSYLVVAVGNAVKEFGGIVNLNETGAFLWRLLEKSSTEPEMVDALLNEYESIAKPPKKTLRRSLKNLRRQNSLNKRAYN